MSAHTLRQSAIESGIVVALVLSLGCVLPAPANDPLILPVVEDPSPVVDGDLGEWSNRGIECRLDRAEQVTYGKGAWSDTTDLSGWVRLGYDSQNLFFAGHVVDEVVSQTRSGTELWRGDHVIVFLDFAGSGKPEDILQFGLSPGHLESPGGAGPAVKPEMVVWNPEGVTVGEVAVAARRTADGYDIEAAVPWTVLGVPSTRYQAFALDVAFSDCDQTSPRQETCMSISPAKWDSRSSTRLLPAGLGDRRGMIPSDVFETRRIDVVENLRIEAKGEKTFVIEVDPVPAGRVPTLTFKARADWSKAGGCIAGLHVDVNGEPVPMKALAERPREMDLMAGGHNASWAGKGITLFYSPDFEAVEKTGYKPVGFRACDYVLRLDDIIKEGRNTITFKNNLHFSWAAREIAIAMAEVRLSWWPPGRFKPPKVYRPAPTGPLPRYEPDTRHRVEHPVTVLPGGGLQVSWAGREIVVESRFSKPGGGWAELTGKEAIGWAEHQSPESAGSPSFRSSTARLEVRRSVESFAECILVRDRLTNMSGDLLPVMISHRAQTGDYQELYLCGRPIPRKTGANNVAENPSVVVLGEDSGFGLMAHDDVFRIHCESSCDGRRAYLNDRVLALRPGINYHHEWLIVPLSRPDYWDFVNALRRHFETNFTIPGSFAFFPAPYRKHMPLPLEEIGEFLDRKAVNTVGITTGYEYKGVFAHGPVRRECDPAVERDTVQMLRELRPDAELVLYFNAFDCARAEEDPVRWPACQVLRPDGKNIREGTPYPVYFPTLTNEYGREMDANLEWILDTLGGEGVWWDMFHGYGYHYGEPWDGWSADIDAKRHEIRRRKSSTALISWPWRRKVIERFQREGRPLIANGSPMTTTEYRYHFPRAVETADIGNLCKSHFFTPIALGDHVGEHHEVDAYRHMLKALDWGGLYYWYSSRIRPTRPTLTSYMFPFTPIELHAGYVIGKERILTNRSGLFGWGDEALLAIHVFDRVGKQTAGDEGRRVVRDGRAYAELRLPEGFSAAVVRK